MTKTPENISVYFCKTCEWFFGLFYSSNETEDETEPTFCPVCGSGEEEITFIEDISNYGGGNA